MPSTEGFSDFFYASPDGLELHARVYGETNSGHWPVVCLPGLTRNARDFHELALYLSTRSENPRRIVAFDHRADVVENNGLQHRRPHCAEHMDDQPAARRADEGRSFDA